MGLTSIRNQYHVGILIEEMNHMVTTPRGSNLILLGCHYMLLGVTMDYESPLGSFTDR